MKSTPSTTLFGFVLILAVSLVSGLLARTRSENPLPWRQAWGERLASQARAEGFAVVERAEVEAILAAGTHLVFDAREADEFHAGHLPGAMSLPGSAFDEHFPGILPLLMPEGPILVYCSSPACDAALNLARQLRDAGYPMVSYYADGYEDWTAGEASP